MNVVLVTHDSIFGRYLAAGLHDSGKVDRIVVERRRPSWRYYWRKLVSVGPVNAVFQVWLNRWFRQEGRRHLPDLPFPPHDAVANINAFQFGDDDLVIGFGTSVITRRTLDAMKHGFLNLHTGWLPDYRGVKSEFWTLARNDEARAGWTLHYMTARLDEGDIVVRNTVRIERENPASLRAKLLRDAIPALGEVIDMARQAGLDAIPRFAQGDGCYYTTPTCHDWRRYRRQSACDRAAVVEPHRSVGDSGS